ncbi:uncharacterized protein LOC133824670 isoform X2 [Humulus lupulus]|uniref:uncharacterized protein LOC133824670 isoform X2 n=1 Tax=Humulus lupulus TaxID=3486 RepID=UPI002B40886B|nr:uncharacterized protein LOC133824670 isoform X2 [Humulus lupulus]
MYKSKLQELCQKRHWSLPTYTSAKQGLDHNPSFSAAVIVNGQSFHTSTSSKSSKEAQNDAARIAFDYLSLNGSLDKLPIPSASSFPQPSLPSSTDTAHKGEAAVEEVSLPEFAASSCSSKLSETNVNNIICRHQLDATKVHCPREGQTADKPPEGQVALCEAIFKAGGYFPLHSYYVKVLDYLGIAPMQLAPNSWLILACMCILYHQEGYEDPTPEEIGHLYGLKKTSQFDHGYYCLCCHVPQSSVIEGMVSNTGSWKSEFFFVSGVPVKNTNFQHAKSRITRSLPTDAAERVKNILGLDVSRRFTANLFKEETLRMSGLLKTDQVAVNLFTPPLLCEKSKESKSELVVEATPKRVSVKLKVPPSKRQKKNPQAEPASLQTALDEVVPDPNQATLDAQDQAPRVVPSQLEESLTGASELMAVGLPSWDQEAGQQTPILGKTTTSPLPLTKVFPAGLGLPLPSQDLLQVDSPGATSSTEASQNNGLLPDQLRFVERVSSMTPKAVVLLTEGECRSSNLMVFPQIFDHALARSLVTTADVLRCTELYKDYEAKYVLLKATHKEAVDQLTKMGCELQQKCKVLTQQNEEQLIQKGVLEMEKASLVQSLEGLQLENSRLGEELVGLKALNLEKVGVIQRLEGTQAKALKDLECKRLGAERAAKESQELKDRIFTLELENEDLRTRCEEELEPLDEDAITDRTSESLLYTLWSEHPEFDYSALGKEFVANCIAKWTAALEKTPSPSRISKQGNLGCSGAITDVETIHGVGQTFQQTSKGAYQYQTPHADDNTSSVSPQTIGSATAVSGNTFRDVQHLYKSHLQMYAQKKNLALPTYSCEREGPPHASRFKCRVTVDGKIYESSEYFPTLKEAEHAAAKVALASLSPDVVQKDDSTFYKNLLQELVQKEGFRLPTYSTERFGEAHCPVFVSTVEIEGKHFSGEKEKTKKLAESSAAKAAYDALRDCKSSQSLRCLPSSQKVHEAQNLLSPCSKSNVSVNVTTDAPMNLSSSSIPVQAEDQTGFNVTTDTPMNLSSSTIPVQAEDQTDMKEQRIEKRRNMEESESQKKRNMKNNVKEVCLHLTLTVVHGIQSLPLRLS